MTRILIDSVSQFQSMAFVYLRILSKTCLKCGHLKTHPESIILE